MFIKSESGNLYNTDQLGMITSQQFGQLPQWRLMALLNGNKIVLKGQSIRMNKAESDQLRDDLFTALANGNPTFAV